MRFGWDEKKRKKLADTRGIFFEKLVEIFSHPYHLSQKNDQPEQWRAIGWSEGRLVSLIFEEREDDDGICYWFITAWIATKEERRMFRES